MSPAVSFRLAAATTLVLAATLATSFPLAAAPRGVSTQESTAPTVAKAIFAGGCFWCMEHPFDELDGVIATISGYTGGRVKSPTYEQVSSGRTGHLESVEVVYDASKVSYQKLLDVFWRNVDPTDPSGQFCDRGEQYTTAVFVHDAEQRRLAEASRQKLSDSGVLDKPVVTPIRDAVEFYPAEDYHQDYYIKNPLRYKYYRRGCGRDRVLEKLWGQAPSS